MHTCADIIVLILASCLSSAVASTTSRSRTRRTRHKALEQQEKEHAHRQSKMVLLNTHFSIKLARVFASLPELCTRWTEQGGKGTYGWVWNSIGGGLGHSCVCVCVCKRRRRRQTYIDLTYEQWPEKRRRFAFGIEAMSCARFSAPVLLSCLCEQRVRTLNTRKHTYIHTLSHMRKHCVRVYPPSSSYITILSVCSACRQWTEDWSVEQSLFTWLVTQRRRCKIDDKGHIHVYTWQTPYHRVLSTCPTEKCVCEIWVREHLCTNVCVCAMCTADNRDSQRAHVRIPSRVPANCKTPRKGAFDTQTHTQTHIFLLHAHKTTFLCAYSHATVHKLYVPFRISDITMLTMRKTTTTMTYVCI